MKVNGQDFRFQPDGSVSLRFLNARIATGQSLTLDIGLSGATTDRKTTRIEPSEAFQNLLILEFRAIVCMLDKGVPNNGIDLVQLSCNCFC